jgi:transposase
MTIPTSAELRRKYQEMTQRELAAFFGTTLHEVRKWFKTYGIKASRVAEAEKPAPATLSEYYSKGMSQRQLAQHFGVSYATMRKWFSEVSLKASRSANHNKGGAPKGSNYKYLYSKAELERLYNHPMSFRKIAKLYKTTEAKVRKDFVAFGLQARRGGQRKRFSEEALGQRLRASRKSWVSRNSRKKLDYTNKWKKKMMTQSVEYRLMHNLRSRAHAAIKCKGNSKLVGCTGAELCHHIESLFLEGMTWENYGLKGWHIDHIKPLSSFDLRDPDQIKACFHWTNLQPLWAIDNLRKDNNTYRRRRIDVSPTHSHNC